MLVIFACESFEVLPLLHRANFFSGFAVRRLRRQLAHQKPQLRLLCLFFERTHSLFNCTMNFILSCFLKFVSCFRSFLVVQSVFCVPLASKHVALQKYSDNCKRGLPL